MKKILKAIGLFFLLFLPFYIAAWAIWGVDENNTIQAPDIAVFIWFVVAAAGTWLIMRNKSKRSVKVRESNRVLSPESVIEPVLPRRYHESVVEPVIPQCQYVPLDIDSIIEEEEAWRMRQRHLSPLEEELYKIDHMEGESFEAWCAELLKKSGFEDVQRTGKSGDQGVDILATKDGITYAIQCKCYSRDLGNKPIQEVSTGKQMYHCHIGAVMTNRGFTKGALDAATVTGTLLWGRDKLKEWLENALDAGNAHVERISSGVPKMQESSHYDELLPSAVDVILETKQASISMLQRRLKLDYTRAAHIIDQLAKLGIIGEYTGSTPRRINVKENPLK